MYLNHQVLHRDISEGNVLVKQSLENTPEPVENVKEEAENVGEETSSAEPSSEASVQTEGVKAQPCFIGRLLNPNLR
jgi:hypothetical protein